MKGKFELWLAPIKIPLVELVLDLQSKNRFKIEGQLNYQFDTFQFSEK